MIVVDKNARIVDFNSSFLKVFNIDSKIAFGHRVFDFLHPSQWRNAIRNFQKTWESGLLKNMEYKIRRPDGFEFDGEVSSSAIYDANGLPESMILIVKNITERKEAERKLREAKEKAEESDRLKTAFLSNMSHEIRTPMNAIVGFSDLLSDPGLSEEEQKEFIEQINHGADNLMHLIDDIIDIAKIESGQITIHNAACVINEVFREVYMLFSQNIKRLGKDEVEIRINWEWPEERLVLLTDQFRLKQVLSNLVGNAIKFTDKGYVVIGIRDAREGVMFYVKDTGIGIKEEKQRVIFDRFMQGHETKTRLYGGTGLGLAISKSIIELMGGEIKLESVSGKGSIFSFILPADVVTDGNGKSDTDNVGGTQIWNDKTILVAEDDHSNFFLIKEALKRTGAQIIWSQNGEETIRLFRENPNLDLVMMDVQMPIMDGYHCAGIIKKERPELPVIAQTAYAMAGERQISRKAGCDDYISKPIKIKELIMVISKFLK
jgi:PAS domain S-box-containing protein